MRYKEYDRQKAIQYAEKWALGRNPQYYNFDMVGGDCTSFVSQILYAGGAVMNYSQYGWYYKSGYDKSPSWSGVEYFYKFIVNNKSIGPYGKEVEIEKISKGDVIQLSFGGNTFHHSLMVVNTVGKVNKTKDIFVATHTENSYNRRLSTYTYDKIRFIKIEGIHI